MFLKFALFFTNFCLMIVSKLTMIQSEKNLILRDLACINLVYMFYVLTYPFAGFNKTLFCLYLAAIMHRIIAVRYID